MDQFENTEKELGRYDNISGQLLQVWRDYYDEIFEINMTDGSYESIMDTESIFWSPSGFVNIEALLMAEKYLHLDDKDTFMEFFDLDKVLNNMHNGIYVTKLNFRMRSESGQYFWVKVKNIIPTKRTGDDIRFFACLRRVDNETNADLQYKRELSDALESAKTLAHKRNNVIKQIFKEVKTPLNGIIGMVGLALNEAEDENVRARLLKLEDEAFRMHRAISLLAEANSAVDTEELNVTFMDRPVNRINYTKQKEEALALGEGERDIPEDFAYVPGIDDTPGAFVDEDVYGFAGKKFLIAEDNELNADVMVEMITSVGGEADVVTDGKSAVIKFVSQPAGTYDMILMDIEMPILDGYSTTRCIRISGKDDAQTIPIFAVTSNSSEEDVVKSLDYGFDAYFVKPINYTTLFERIDKEFNSREDNE